MVVLAFAINVLCTGCGTGMTVVAAMESPTISQVSPQVVTAGTPSVTVTVQGANFQSQAALTVNGTAVPTTVVNSTTLAANISGTPLAQPAVAQLQVKNSNGTASNQVPLTVTTASDSVDALSITTTHLPSAQVGVSYEASLAATGGQQPYRWSVSSGSLPSGLTLSNSGVISGTPTASGTFIFGVTVAETRGQSKTVTYSIVVTAAQSVPTALSISSAALGSGQVGSTYAASLSASGGTPSYTWSLASGSLPAGLALSSAGVISGTPTASGTSTFTVTVKDSGSPAQTQSARETITINAATPTNLTITSTSLGSAKTGSSYSATLSASGGTPGYTWSITSGSLPAGLALSSAGVISGTPTASGTSTFTVGVQDSGSPVQTASAQESIAVSAAPSTLTITSTSLSAAQKGSSYSATLSASGGTPGYTWSVASGSLPAGLALSSGGVISGTPTATGTATFTVAVKDSGSPVQTASAQESITVSTTPATLTITSTNLGAAQSGTSYSATLSASGGTPGYTWSIASGSLPAGLSMSSGGVISGTPTASGTATFTVAVKDSGSPVQTASAQESIAVSAAPSTLTITSTSLAAGKSGTSYSATLSASGGTPAYTWSITSGSLPAGLSMSSGGVISGTPTASGTATFTVAVKDSGSPAQTASAQESIAVSAASSTLTITSTSLGAAQTGSSYSTTLAATGGTPSYTWSIASGSLPAGLSMSSGGVISGTPTASGTATFTVAVKDSGSPVQTASAQESLTVAAGTQQLTITTVALGYGTSGIGYSATLNASGGTPGYTWSIASGSLPAGLSLSSAGVISGTPTASGTSTFTVSVADSASPAATASQQESITVNTHNSSGSGTPQIYVYPQTPVAPRGSYQTVTAVVTGVNDKTVTWTTDGGTIVGTNPCVVNEPCTVALYTTATGTYHLTAKSNANGSLAATSTITITQSPVAVTTHPRLLITASMLPDLRAKAVSSNPMYQSIRTSAINAFNADNAVWSWSCNGGSGLPSSFQGGKEYDARLFAYMALVDSSDSTYNWGCYGRDTWTYAMNQVISGAEPIVGNTWSDTAVNFAVNTDWLMGSNSLSTADQTLARQFLAYLAQTVLSYYYGITPPVTGYNSPALAGNAIGNMRSMGNNYTMSKLMLMAAIGLTFNDTTSDDPALSNSCGATRYQVCSDYSAGSLHAYWSYFDGSMLYMDWAHLEDPVVSQQAYNAAYSNVSSQPTCQYTDGSSHPCFGDGRDGASSEGSWYQYSMYKLRYALNMMHTAGYDDPTLYGPQVSLGTSSWWDLKYVNDLEFMTDLNAKNGPAVCGNCVSPAYGYLTTGDSNTYYRTSADMYTEAAMMSADSYVGRTDRTSALEWMVLDTAYGGADGSRGGCNTWCGFDSGLNAVTAGPLAIDLMISLPASDPVSNVPSNPRPSLPTDIYNASYAQQLILRSGWTSNDTLFSFYCASALIDHEHENCGRFDVYSNGEYITKGRTEFDDYNEVMSSAPQSNEASYLNTTGSGCGPGCLVYPAVEYGGEFTHGQQQGIVSSLVHSELPAYAAMTVDDTPAYNGWWAYSSPYDVSSYNDVQHASRDVLFLRGSNQVVFYDRGVTGSASDKSVSLTTTGAASVNANTASWPTQSGTQKAYYTALLPTQGSLSNAGLLAGNAPQVSDWEPVSSIREDAGAVSTAQFLSVLQWGASSFAPSGTTLVQSASGQNFDGALVGSSLAMFMRTWSASFTGVVYPASGATTQYVLDLTPNTTYSITGAGAPATATTDTAGVLTFSAAGTGSITVAPSH